MNHRETENRGIDEITFRQVMIRFKRSTALGTMGISVNYLAPGKSELSMKVSPEYINSLGVQHGGVTCALADTAMGYAVQSTGVVGPTLDLNINYCAPIFLGTELTAVGEVVHAGKTALVAEASIYDPNGKLLARSRGTFFRSSPGQAE